MDCPRRCRSLPGPGVCPHRGAAAPIGNAADSVGVQLSSPPPATPSGPKLSAALHSGVPSARAGVPWRSTVRASGAAVVRSFAILFAGTSFACSKADEGETRRQAMPLDAFIQGKQVLPADPVMLAEKDWHGPRPGSARQRHLLFLNDQRY